MLYRVFDAAYPPPAAPPGCAGVLGYIGGSRAAHVWPAKAWLPFRGLRQFPCWVPSLSDNAREAGRFAVRAARELGWAPGPKVGPRVIVIDMETLADRVWYSLCAAEVAAGGFEAVSLRQSLSR